MKAFYFVTTEHLEEALWFRDDEDFAVGMNHVAIGAFRFKVLKIFVFILMSNHVHFLIYGEYEDVVRFINEFKGRYSHYYQKKYGKEFLLRENGLRIEMVSLDHDGFEWTAAYVMMNCVHANICSHPSQYPWGSGGAVFQITTPKATRLGELTGRGLRKFLHSGEKAIPKDWLISDQGFILPQNYVDTKEVERRFRHIGRFNYFLNNSAKVKKRLEENRNLPAFRDQTILTAVPDLIRSLFGKAQFSDLTLDEQTELIRQIRYRFSADVNQAARVCGITYAEAGKLVDRV